MAFIKKNQMMQGMSGSIGNVTFRVRENKTVSGPRPSTSKKPPTEEQLAVQLKFERFAAYAQKAIANPATKAMYAAAAKPGQTAFNAAFQDAVRPPSILDIDTRYYKGIAGNEISFRVKDVVRVESVKVTILSAAGAELEQGDAVPDVGNYWKYTATAANAAVLGARILITATDLPGNVTEIEEVI